MLFFIGRSAGYTPYLHNLNTSHVILYLLEVFVRDVILYPPYTIIISKILHI